MIQVMYVSFLDDILFMAIDCQNNKRLLTKTWRNLEFVLSVKNSMQETRSITREEEIMKADRDSRIWLKDNPSNVRALQRTSLIISWLKTLSYMRKNPSINNPTAKSCKKKKTIKIKLIIIQHLTCQFDKYINVNL